MMKYSYTVQYTNMKTSLMVQYIQKSFLCGEIVWNGKRLPSRSEDFYSISSISSIAGQTQRYRIRIEPCIAASAICYLVQSPCSGSITRVSRGVLNCRMSHHRTRPSPDPSQREISSYRT